MMALCLMISVFLSLIIMIISSILSKKKFINREKMSPFECGFDPKISARTTFSIHFFLIAILFLVFDIEITMIMPFIKIDFSNTIYMSMSLTLIIMIMIIGLLHEWKQGALKWKL